MNDTALVNAVAAIDPAAPVEVLADAIGKVDAAKRFLREVDADLTARLLEHVQANGPVTVGTVRYYAGTEKVTKVRDARQAMHLLLEATGGDVDTLAELQAANAWKPGACRTVLGDRWGEVFEVTEKTVLKDGKPVRAVGLQRADERFLK